MMQPQKSVIFVSRTAVGRDEQAKLQQLFSGLNNAYDSIPFRQPVDWKSLNLLDYPSVITKPMDLSTVRRKISGKNYQYVQDCLQDINLIWQNAKLYNPKQHAIHKLADKFQKQTKKMIRNYLPFVKMENTTNKKKITKKQIKPIKTINKVQQPKTYLEKQQQAKNQHQIQKQQPDQLPHIAQRKNLFCLMQLCTKDQIGVIFLLIKSNCPQCLQFDQNGIVSVNGQKINDVLLKRLTTLIQMWGINYKNAGNTNNKRK